ncbi:MAG TPA: MlaD family protein [Chitinophagales bacterium]|nr:MlaD family protein [Chitinophagales bacterium]
MSKSTSQTIKLGIFVVTGTLLLVVGLYFIGQKKFIFSKNIELFAVFENANGLKVGNNVRYSGVNIGTVDKIEMIQIGKINVQMSLEKKTAAFIKKDAIASIGSDGLVGSMVLSILPGEKLNEKAVVNGDTILSQKKVGTDEMLATLNKTNENAALLSADLLKITKEILEGKGTIGTLINDTILSNNVRQTVIGLKKTSEEANLAIMKVNNIIAKINYDESAAAVILSDTAAANQIKNILANLEKSSQDINKVTVNVNDYINEIKSSKGVVNHIIKDENLVRDIDSTMMNIKESSVKLNENLEALKHNFLFRGYFRKLERKEQKENK